jgi:hypothetical protein
MRRQRRPRHGHRPGRRALDVAPEVRTLTQAAGQACGPQRPYGMAGYPQRYPTCERWTTTRAPVLIESASGAARALWDRAGLGFAQAGDQLVVVHPAHIGQPQALPRAEARLKGPVLLIDDSAPGAPRVFGPPWRAGVRRKNLSAPQGAAPPVVRAHLVFAREAVAMMMAAEHRLDNDTRSCRGRGGARCRAPSGGCFRRPPWPRPR